MKLNLFDSHVHTDNSFDGTHSLTYLCECGVEKGIMGLAVTDHYDCDRVEEFGLDVRLRQCLFDIQRTRRSFEGEIRIATGIELGQGHRFPEIARYALSQAEFDVVLGSVHDLEDGRDIMDINFNDPHVVVSQVLTTYYQEILEMIRWGQFDVLAHLGYPERTIWGKYRIPVHLTPFRPLIDEILRELIRQEKALEVNTRTLRQTVAKTIPHREVLARYRELGGRLITLGSDAHRVEDLAAGFDVAMDQLLELGYTEFCFYKNRQPVMLRLL